MSATAEAILSPNRELRAHGVGIAGRLQRGLTALRALAPYAAIELLLPGGSLLALALWIYRRYATRSTTPT